MKRVSVSLPDDAATALEELSAVLGVTQSGFLAAYLSTRICRLRDVAVEADYLHRTDPAPRRFGRGHDAELVRIAQDIADAVEASASAE